MKKILVLLLLTVSLTNASIAQKKISIYNSLLWRISGKKLSKPSYIFGTMHLTDKRIFNFSDSLYHFLETTDGFATELDMEEIMPQMISEIAKENTDKPIVDLVKSVSLDRYKTTLEKILKIPLDKITISDLKSVKGKFMTQLLKKGEMNTIIDMYLFDIARRQGKWVGGIEDFEDQYRSPDEEEEILSMINEATQDQVAAKKTIEWMIKTYVNQDLDAIDLSSALLKGGQNDILIRRNVKMTRRMDSILNIRTCLFAVGAAHLPGDSGVIELLRKKGFIVEPVYSSKIIEPSKYTFTEKALPWEETSIKGDWYALQMPGKSNELKLSEDIPFNMQMYFDLAKMNVYFTVGTAIPKKRNISTDSMYRFMAENFSKKGTIISEKKIAVNSNEGKEFIIKSDDMDLRLQAFLSNTGVVVNAMGSYKYDSLYGKDAGDFFQSFRVIKDPPPLPVVFWKTYLFPKHAFSIKFPVPYTEQKRNKAADTVWRTNVYIATTNDKIELTCGMMVMEAQSGYYSDTDSTYFELMKKNILASTKGEDVESKFMNFLGFPSYEFLGKIKYEKENLYLKAKFINSGNRRYYLYAVYKDSANTKSEVEVFFNSFNFIPIPAQQWNYQLSPAKDISVWAPAPLHFQKHTDSSTSLAGFILYDSLTPSSILINKEFLSPYAWWKSDSAFFKQQATRFVNDENDSLTNYRLIKNGAGGGADFCIISKNNHNVKKVRMLLNGDTLYYAFCHLPPGLLASPDYSRLFNDIKFSKEKPGGYHLYDKTTRILHDMAEADSTSFEKAVNSLQNASFTAVDLPLLQNALLQPYRDFNPSKYSAHDKLINKVLDIDDGSTFNFIKNKYATLKDSSEILKYSFLSLLLRLKTKESFDLFEQLIVQERPRKGDIMILENTLTDSLALTATIFPKLLTLSGDTSIIKLLPSVANILLDSGLIRIASLDPYKKYFYPLIEKQLKNLIKEKPAYDRISNNYINFLSHFKEPISYQLLQQFLSSTTMPVKNAAAIALIKNDQKVSGIQLEKIAADDNYRIGLYESFSELGKEKLFPVKYLTQQLFAKSELYLYASDEYNADSITFISEKTATFMGKSQKFYLFKISYTTDEDKRQSYLGITGPYSITPGKIITSSKASGLYTDESFDLKKINQQFKIYLKQWEKYLIEENNK